MDSLITEACRACMKIKSCTVISIFSNDLQQKFEYCLDLKILENDKAPSILCDSCADSIVKFSEFKLHCLKADSFWKSQTIEEIYVSNDISIDIPEFDNEELDNKECIDLEINKNTSQNNVYIENIKEEYSDDVYGDNVEEIKMDKGRDCKQNVKSNYNIECEKSGKKFKKKTTHKIHLRKCTKASVVSHGPSGTCCGICDMNTKNQEEMKSHLIEHETSGVLTCKSCDIKPIDMAQLFSHRFKHLPEKTAIQCHICNKKYRNRNKFEFHYRGVHLKLSPGICPVCLKEYKTYKKWIGHVKLHSEWNYECAHCGRKYLYKYELNAHLKEVCKPKDIICELCAFTTKKLYNLKIHIEAQHSNIKPVHCKICDTLLKSDSSLRQHMKRSHAEKNIVCPDCNKRFKDKYMLNNHMIWHSDVRPFKCGLCDNTFKVKSQLVVHMRLHTGEKPYSCDICYSNFKVSSALKRHKALRHGIVTKVRPKKVTVEGK